MKDKLKKTLTSLWTGELVATAMFWLNYGQLMWGDTTRGGGSIFGTNAYLALTYSLAMLSLILVQGSAYWLILFALVEWVNYYTWRLSYSYNPAVLIGLIRRGKLKRSKIALEIAELG